MSSNQNDPRRLDRVKPYKAAAGVQGTSGAEDFISDYMNILGMIMRWVVYFFTNHSSKTYHESFFEFEINHGVITRN